MTIKSFATKVVNLFQSRKDSKRIKPRITRGRAIDCSSEIEELFAIAISEIIPKKYSLFIDYPLSIKKSNKTLVIYPDISLVEDNILKGIVEIKIDLGYLKKAWIKNSNSIYQSIIKSKSIKYRKHVGQPNKEKDLLTVSPKLKRSVIVLTGKNAHNKLESFTNTQSDCFVIFPSHHPNTSKVSKEGLNKFIKDMYGNDKQWNKMVNYFEKNFK